MAAIEPQDQKIYNHLQNKYMLDHGKNRLSNLKNKRSLKTQQLHETTFAKEKAEDINMILDGKTLADKKTPQELI
eukprot:12009186-Ditylum_brightwellii.AAC.1